MAEHRMLEPIEGGSSRDRQARSKASDVVLTLSSASMECAALAVARPKLTINAGAGASELVGSPNLVQLLEQ
ncbi:hypothetical protein TYRP_015536 [Tyrophagus putrescentiae]|nr:hypothetical protein TYRP_015536 [Tyrophagus putrescentiae]